MDYYLKNKENSTWMFGNEKCQDYDYLPTWERQLKCFLGTSQFRLMSNFLILIFETEEIQFQYVNHFYYIIYDSAREFISKDIDEFLESSHDSLIFLLVLVAFIFSTLVVYVFYIGKKVRKLDNF